MLVGGGASFGHMARNGSFRDSESELEELAVDARRAPSRISQGHLFDQPPDFPASFRVVVSVAVPGDEIPIKPEAPAVPDDDRFRFHEKNGVFQSVPEFRQPNEQDTVSLCYGRPRVLPFENFDLLAQDDVLENKISFRTEDKAQRPKRHGDRG